MSEIRTFIEEEIAKPYPAEIDLLVQAILERSVNKGGVVAVLLYGSGLWQDPDKAGDDVMWDLHVLVDGYGDFDHSWLFAAAGNILPHNVLYIETQRDQGQVIKDGDSASVLRCKYNVMRMSQFQKHASGRCFTPQVWARFCQPCRLVYARDNNARAGVVSAVLGCIRTFLRQSMPFVDGRLVSWDDIWVAGFTQTYRDELRSESKNRPEQFIDASQDYFKRVLFLSILNRTVAARVNNLADDGSLDDEGDIDVVRFTYPLKQLSKARFRRNFLRPFRKFVAFARLAKALFTFENAVDYALWKIERHSGQKIILTKLQRRFPLIYGWPVIFSLYRRNILK